MDEPRSRRTLVLGARFLARFCLGQVRPHCGTPTRLNVLRGLPLCYRESCFTGLLYVLLIRFGRSPRLDGQV